MLCSTRRKLEAGTLRLRERFPWRFSAPLVQVGLFSLPWESNQTHPLSRSLSIQTAVFLTTLPQKALRTERQSRPCDDVGSLVVCS